MEIGRPVAVVIERFNPGLASASSTVLAAAVSATAAGTANYQPFSVSLSIAESPPPYSGDFTNSTVTVSPVNPGSGNTLKLTGFTLSDTWWDQQIKLYDAVQINFQPMLYRITNAPVNAANVIQNSGSVAWTLTPNNAQPVNPSFSPSVASGTPVRFQIFRQPIRSAADPLQLPEGIVIDLAESGMSTQVNGFDTTVNPVIAFAPSGNIDMLYDAIYNAGSHPNGYTGHPIGSIFLLLGRREQVAISGFTPPLTNLADLNSLWVAVGYQTGQVTTSENYVPSSAGQSISNYTSTTDPTGVLTARTLATGSFKSGVISPVTTMGGN